MSIITNVLLVEDGIVKDTYNIYQWIYSMHYESLSSEPSFSFTVVLTS